MGSLRRVCGVVLKPCPRFCRGLIYAQRCVAAADSRNTRRGALSNCRGFAGRRQPPLGIRQSRRINLRRRLCLSCLSRAARGGISFRDAVVVVFRRHRGRLVSPLSPHPANISEAFPAVCLPPLVSTVHIFTTQAF